MDELLREVLPSLGLDEAYAAEHLDVREGNVLPSRLPVNALACGSVAAAGLALVALRGGDRVTLDPGRVGASFRGDQLLTVDGVAAPGFAPLSGFFQTRDGWVRTHANYPHHRERLLRALDLPASVSRSDAAAAMAGWSAQELEDVVAADHGIAVRVRDAAEWARSEQAAAVDRHPLLAVTQAETSTGAGTRAVSEQPRVLDLTRVIAGPVATRTLALAGCDVLRVDTPHLPELEPQHLDMDVGKRSTLADLHDEHARRRVHELLDSADVLVTGYRPGALAAYGLDPEVLAETHPHLVCATLSAWTPSGPWGGRRGFDSIVQAATGIAMIESPDDQRPGALPAQALDHATGYLLAAGVLTALRLRSTQGSTWRVSAHLARTAHWLLGADAVDAAAHDDTDLARWTVATPTDLGVVVQAAPALVVDGRPGAWTGVGRRWGADEAAWLPGEARSAGA